MNDAPAEAKIDPEFQAWTRELTIAGDRESLVRRWKGLQALADDFDSDLLETAIKLIYRTKPAPSKEHLDAFKKYFITHDEVFDQGDLGRELELLAGAVLDTLLKGTLWTAEAGLAIQTAACLGQRTAELPFDLIGRSDQRLAEFSKQQRTRTSKNVQVAKLTFEAARKKLEAQQDWAGAMQAFATAGESANTYLQALATSASNAIKAMEKTAELMDEELQILWWLTSGHSRTLNRSLASVEESAKPIVFAFELAHMTAVAPGPASIVGILQRAGVQASGSCSIVAAVNACDKGWLESQIAMYAVSAALAPLHFAIQRKLETGDEVAWVAAWASLAGMDSQTEFDATALALQFYKERLLVKFLSQS